jgi:ADP-dependent NAD(P)H-hydrate dehydratase / NAD(P)H-hydrate epimerase
MEFILTPDEMRKADASAIEDKGVPSIILMENAARSAAEYILEIFELNDIVQPSVSFFCGSGNNGGDGFAMARHMMEHCVITVYWIGDIEKMSDETRTNFQALINLGVDLIHIRDEDELELIDLDTDCLIDSMIGVGGSENIRGLALEILKLLYDHPGMRIAVDAPTGLNTETGIAGEYCFSADLTITMFAIKSGMLLNDGINVCGEIVVANLGVPQSLVSQISQIKCIEDTDVHHLLPKRIRVSSKFDYGRVVVIAGSKRFPGAAALTSNAAIKAGAGLVQLYSSSLHPTIMAEVIPYELTATKSGSIDKSNAELLRDEINKADVIAIGPGLSDDDDTIELARKIIYDSHKDKAIVVDADALRAIDTNKKLRKNIILTPHTGEMARITGIDRKEIEMNSAWIAKEWAEKLECTILLKHVPVIISDGDVSYWNMSGNSGMATGGSGDVLTGIIAALLGQGLSPINAASLAAYLQGKSGDIYTAENKEHTLTASRILEYLDRAFSTSSFEENQK